MTARLDEHATARTRLLVLVHEPGVDPAAWEDHFLDVGLDLLAEARAAGDGDVLAELDRLTGSARLRLMQVLLLDEGEALFDPLLGRLTVASPDEAELLIDHLRGWDLTAEQRDRLRAAAAPLRGRSKRLDQVIAAL